MAQACYRWRAAALQEVKKWQHRKGSRLTVACGSRFDAGGCTAAVAAAAALQVALRARRTPAACRAARRAASAPFALRAVAYCYAKPTE